MNNYTQALRPGFVFLAVALLSLAPTVASARVVAQPPLWPAMATFGQLDLKRSEARLYPQHLPGVAPARRNR